MQILKGHRFGKPVRCLAFSPDGTKLASTGVDDMMFVWDLNTGERWQVVDGYASSVTFSPDSKLVVMPRYDGVILWEFEAREGTLFEADPIGSFGERVAFAADGQTLILVGNSIRLLDSVSGAILPASGYEARGGFAVRSLALTADRRTMATGHKSPHTVRIWDVEARSLRDEIAGPTATLSALALDPNGRYLAAAAGSTLWVWAVASKQVVVKHTINRKYYKDLAFTPDGRFLVFARNDATVSLWDTTTWTEAASYDFRIGPMISVACAPDSMRAAGGSGKGKVVVWDIDM